MLSIKTLHNNLSSIDNATKDPFFKHFKPSEHASSLFLLASNSLFDVIIRLVRSTHSFANWDHIRMIFYGMQHFYKISLFK